MIAAASTPRPRGVPGTHYGISMTIYLNFQEPVRDQKSIKSLFAFTFLPRGLEAGVCVVGIQVLGLRLGL